MQSFLNRLQAIAQSHQTSADYAKTLALLAALKSGEIKLEQVNLIDGGWQVTEPKLPEAIEKRMEPMVPSDNGTKD